VAELILVKLMFKFKFTPRGLISGLGFTIFEVIYVYYVLFILQANLFRLYIQLHADYVVQLIEPKSDE